MELLYRPLDRLWLSSLRSEVSLLALEVVRIITALAGVPQAETSRVHSQGKSKGLKQLVTPRLICIVGSKDSEAAQA